MQGRTGQESDGEDNFGHGSAATAGGERSLETGVGLAAVDGERDRVKQILPRPAGSQVDADAAGGLAHASADLEQPGAQGFDLG